MAVIELISQIVRFTVKILTVSLQSFPSEIWRSFTVKNNVKRFGDLLPSTRRLASSTLSATRSKPSAANHAIKSPSTISWATPTTAWLVCTARESATSGC